MIINLRAEEIKQFIPPGDGVYPYRERNTMKAIRFMRQPFFISGFKVEAENMEAVARWCEGHVVTPESGQPFIRVPVDRATNRKQTEAHIGMWVTVSKQRGEKSFKVYTEEFLFKGFFEIPEDEIDTLSVIEDTRIPITQPAFA